jgi:hypothetical protein
VALYYEKNCLRESRVTNKNPLLQVPRLANPAYLVEIDVIAVLPPKGVNQGCQAAWRRWLNLEETAVQ